MEHRDRDRQVVSNSVSNMDTYQARAQISIRRDLALTFLMLVPQMALAAWLYARLLTLDVSQGEAQLWLCGFVLSAAGAAIYWRMRTDIDEREAFTRGAWSTYDTIVEIVGETLPQLKVDAPAAQELLERVEESRPEGGRGPGRPFGRLSETTLRDGTVIKTVDDLVRTGVLAELLEAQRNGSFTVRCDALGVPESTARSWIKRYGRRLSASAQRAEPGGSAQPGAQN